MGKIIALDFGLKRTGIALSDETKTFAFGHKTVDSKLLMQELEQIIKKEKIETIVLGEPKRLDGSDGHVTQNVYLLKEALEKKFDPIQIQLLDERFTSKMAAHSLAISGHSKKMKNDKSIIDTVSATLILQDYLRSNSL